MAAAKIQTVRGRVETFFVPFAKKYYSFLDGLDSWNGHKMLIAYGKKICYTWGDKLIDKSGFVRH